MLVMGAQGRSSIGQLADNHVKRVSWQLSRCIRDCGRMYLAVILVLGLPFAHSGDISCQGIRYTYFKKGLDTNDVPATPQQGKKGFHI